MRAVGLLVLAVLLSVSPAWAAELVLFETPTCPWCIKWHRDIGVRYDNTKAGHLLPLRRVDMLKPLPADIAALPHVASIPTFVIVQCGQEVGRVVGYSSEASFWRELAEALNEAGQPDGC
ncbi:MAG: hypothetical protein H7Z12_19685 [Rhodospirillaceae bacterium]|nr:hypothetical protein [Rhodospirillales bacterium]